MLNIYFIHIIHAYIHTYVYIFLVFYRFVSCFHKLIFASLTNQDTNLIYIFICSRLVQLLTVRINVISDESISPLLGAQVSEIGEYHHLIKLDLSVLHCFCQFILHCPVHSLFVSVTYHLVYVSFI